ncbi:MAG: crossover junction endodeoxyribonuclease RuvC, partial [Patescibacteria group bacterium]
MVILGIDPGTTRIGFGVVEKQGSNFRACVSGLFASPSDPLLFEKELLTLLKKHKPDAVAIEKVFFGKNQKTALAVSEMRGVIKFIIQKQNILILEYTPLEIKQSITGYGRAEKTSAETTPFVQRVKR